MHDNDSGCVVSSGKDRLRKFLSYVLSAKVNSGSVITLMKTFIALVWTGPSWVKLAGAAAGAVAGVVAGVAARATAAGARVGAGAGEGGGGGGGIGPGLFEHLLVPSGNWFGSTQTLQILFIFIAPCGAATHSAQEG